MKYTFNDKDHCAHQDWLPYEYRKVHEGSGGSPEGTRLVAMICPYCGTTVALDEESRHEHDYMRYDTRIKLDKERT